MRAYKKIRTFKIVAEPSAVDNTKIISSETAYQTFKPFFGDAIDVYESFWIMLLNNSNKVVGMVEISKGGITGTTVDIRLIAKYALDSLAVAIIMAHNHPSGTLKPSQPDKTITEKVKKAMQTLDINLLDHLIITKDGFFSFADEQLI